MAKCHLATFFLTNKTKTKMAKKIIDFDLVSAITNPESVVCRNGDKPLEWHYFKNIKSQFKLIYINKFGEVTICTTDGLVSIGEKWDADLMLEAQDEGATITYHNLYESGFIGLADSSIEDCIKNAGSAALYVVKTTISTENAEFEIVHKY